MPAAPEWTNDLPPVSAYETDGRIDFASPAPERVADERPAPAGPFVQAVAAKPSRTAGIAASKRHDHAVGVDGIEGMPDQIFDVSHGSEAWIAINLLTRLRAACGGPVIYSHGEFWVYGPTEWRKLPIDLLHRIVHRYDAATCGKSLIKLKHSTVRGILAAASMEASQPDFFDDPTVGMNTRSGTIVLENGRAICRPHSPDDRLRFTIDAEFNFGAATDLPRKGTMLHRLLFAPFKDDDDWQEKMLLIGEALGAAAFGLATRVKQPKAIVGLGKSANNGKSTIFGLPEIIFPKGSIVSLPPDKFDDEKYAVQLAGAAVNFADELSVGAIASPKFKTAITGNLMTGRDLHKSVVNFKPRALHLFAANDLPRFEGGMDRGVRRRLLVLKFNRTIPDREIVSDILERIRETEMDVLLGFAVAGAVRLVKQGGYTVPQSSKIALDEWVKIDPVHEWVAECCEVGADDNEPAYGWPLKSDAYRRYKAWAEAEGYDVRKLVSPYGFTRIMETVDGVSVKRSDGVRVVGIRIKS